MRITKIRPWRINFELAGLHFSMQKPDELYECGLQLQCKERPELDKYRCAVNLSNFLRSKSGIKRIGCYAHYDMNYFGNQLKRYFGDESCK